MLHDGVALTMMDFLANVSVKKTNTWQNDLLRYCSLDLCPALQGSSGSVGTSSFIIMCVCQRENEFICSGMKECVRNTLDV